MHLLNKECADFLPTTKNTTQDGSYCEPPVTVLTTCLTMLGGLMSSRKMLGSVAKGKPLSSISSSN